MSKSHSAWEKEVAELKTEIAKLEAELHDFRSASCADAVQGEAMYRERAEVAELALNKFMTAIEEERTELLKSATLVLVPGCPEELKIRQCNSESIRMLCLMWFRVGQDG
jgi:hypothetical protein